MCHFVCVRVFFWSGKRKHVSLRIKQKSGELFIYLEFKMFAKKSEVDEAVLPLPIISMHFLFVILCLCIYMPWLHHIDPKQQKKKCI